MKKMLFVVMLLSSLMVIGCSSDEPTSAEDSGDPVDLTDRVFVADSATGHDLVPDTPITFTFQGERLSILAGCNTMAGAYTHDGETLAWDGPAISTRMACETALMEQDEWLNSLLESGVTTSSDGADLVLTAGDVSIEFSEAPQ